MGKVNLFVVGEPRCGTTALYHYFKRHNNCFLPSTKEPKYFCKEYFYKSKANKRYFQYKKLEDYEKLYNFSQDRKYFCDFSTYYLFSKNAAKEIYKYNPEAKIIALFREPVDFLRSWQKQRLKDGLENITDFKKALNMEETRKKKSHKYKPFYERLFYSEWVKFSNHLKRYLDFFPAKNIKVIIYEDFKKDNQKIVDEICSFLGIEKIDINEKHVNARKKFRFQKLRVLFTKNSLIGRYINNLPPKLEKVKRYLIQKMIAKEDKSEINREYKKELMREYKSEVINLNKLLHKYNLMDKDRNLVKFWRYNQV
ncbi:MAG: sulfotransferase family protein [Minisyncoccales bacterium]